jgi:hypothetical protein
VSPAVFTARRPRPIDRRRTKDEGRTTKDEGRKERPMDDTPTETAPIQGGDIAPLPTYPNPNE